MTHHLTKWAAVPDHPTDASVPAQPILVPAQGKHDTRAWTLVRKLAARIEADPSNDVTASEAVTLAGVSLLSGALRLAAKNSDTIAGLLADRERLAAEAEFSKAELEELWCCVRRKGVPPGGLS